MSLYIDKKIEDPTFGAQKTLLSWHKYFPLIAFATFDDSLGGNVCLCKDDCSVLNTKINPRSGVQVTALEWHPSRKSLLIGWENGDLSVWCEHAGREIYAFTRHHNNVLCVLRFSDNGKIFVSGDVEGTFNIWKFEVGGSFEILFSRCVKHSIVDVCFRNNGSLDKDREISRLAKAAVNGDEHALNMFSSWQESDMKSQMNSDFENELNMYIGCLSGIVFYVNKTGSCEAVLQMEASIRYLAHYREKDLLLVMTKSLALAQFSINEDGSVNELGKVKLSGRNTDIVLTWAGEGILAISAGESTVHLWNVEYGRSSTLVLPSANPSHQISSLSFLPCKNILSAGTHQGLIFSWNLSYKNDVDEIDWQVEELLKISGLIRSLEWCQMKEVMALITTTDIFIILKQKMCFAFDDGVSAVQMSARQVVLEQLSQGLTVHLLTETEIKAVFLSKTTVALYCSEKLILYEVNFADQRAMHLGTFMPSSDSVMLHDQSVYVINESKINVRTFQGTLKAYFDFTPEEGEPCFMDASSDYFVASSAKGIIKVWGIGGREAKLILTSSYVKEALQDKNIASIKCCHKGNKISFTAKIKTKTGFIYDPCLYIWDTEKNFISRFDFATGKDIKAINEPEKTMSPKHTTPFAQIISGRYPLNHTWIIEDPRLIVCEARLLPLPLKRSTTSDNFKNILSKQKKGIQGDSERKHDSVIVSLYLTPNGILIIQDYFFLNEDQANLIGLKIPHYYILKKSTKCQETKAPPSANIAGHDIKGYKSLVERKTMPNFVGLEDCDNTTKNTLLNFSYNFAIENFDEAFQVIKGIKSESVWKNMAEMCVKTKRLDVAKICVGKMEHSIAARALRESANEKELEVRVGILAIHLDMQEDAERLFKSCGRYDWLNRLYQSQGEWEKALSIAEKYDRIHLRNTFFNYAAYLEEEGNINSAIKYYEKSGTHRFQVPRMLFEDQRSLEMYVQNSDDPKILQWWAQYLESIEEMETAMQFYKKAQDYLSLVRLYCYCNNLEKAAEIANETGDRAACFHLGRQFEAQENIKEAVHFFTQARSFSNAIRICKDNNLDEQLMNLAMMAGNDEKSGVASYFYKQGQMGNAISLYHKSGNLKCAIELAFKEGEYDVLQKIATELPSDADPQLLQKCAEFFTQRGKYDTAINLLIMGKKFEEALNLCVENNVTISEDLAEKFTLDKNENDKLIRNHILEKIAESCMLQENYHLAAKKFTQAGDKIKAMKALLKSGDTERIIFFANVSRQREIYVMAANYLQSLDWRNDGNIIKHIITFYTKGKALELLASFYEACAQDEIDEYQNYEKALGALVEACKCISKVTNGSEKIENIKVKMELVKQFVEIKQLYESSPDDAVKQCRDLLLMENIETAVRKGDIYGFLIEHFCMQGNFKVAHTILEQMQSTMPGVNLPYYIKVEHLKAIYDALELKPADQMTFLDSKRDNEHDLSENEEVEEDYQAIENRY